MELLSAIKCFDVNPAPESSGRRQFEGVGMGHSPRKAANDRAIAKRAEEGKSQPKAMNAMQRKLRKRKRKK